MGTPLSIFASNKTLYSVSEVTKDTSTDFNNFLIECTLEERISLMQALHAVDIEIKDDYFGTLKNLPPINSFSTGEGEASQVLPLRPKTFNEVLPCTVYDAVMKGYLDRSLFSVSRIKRELIWRRYNKINFIWYDKNCIDYHRDIVMWIADKNDIDNIKFKSTYQLERQIALKYFEKIWDKLTPAQREELMSKIERETNSYISNKTAIALQGGAVAIATLSATVAFTGFAFYTTMSTVICTVAAWFGVTLPFSVYIGASTTVAILSGPIGWCIAGLATIGSAFLLGCSEPDAVAAFIITVNSIKAKGLETGRWK